MSKEKKSRTYFAIKNVFFNFGYQIVNTITNLIVPPLLISKFGSVTNGLVSTIKQIINYIQLVGAGISESSVVSLYGPLAKNDEKKISSIYKACEKTFQNSGIIFSVIAIIIAFVYPIFIKEGLTYFTVVEIILILSVVGSTEFFSVGKYRALLTADQKIYVINIVQSIGAIFSTITTIIMIKLNCNIVIVQFAAMLTYVLRILLLNYYFRKKYSYIDKKANADYSAVSKRKDATIHQLASLIIFGSQTILISNFCGLAEASVYSVYAMIFNGINTILSTISSAMLAGIGNLMAIDENEKVKNIYDIYEFLYYIVVFILYTTVYIMIQPFIVLYIGNESDINYIRSSLIILFSIMGLLNCLRTPGATIINAKGHYRETRNRALIEMSICLVSEILLVKILGIEGILIGTIMAYLYRTIDVILYSNKIILFRNVFKTLKRIVINVVIMIICVIAIKLNYDNITSYFKWIIYSCVIVIFLVFIISSINIIFNMKTMRNLWKYVINVCRKGKND